MKKLSLLSICFVASLSAFSQSQYDTIYSNNEAFACSVKEVTPDAVKFAYPNEDMLNSVYKNTVQKIVFKSGRIQVFAEATYFKSVNNVDDYNNVSFSHVLTEVQGLYKIGEVGSKARGTTALSNMEKVKERAEFKVKIQAAMMGANVVYLTQFGTSQGQVGNQYTPGHATATNISGIAYCNKLPSFDAFSNLMNSKMQFKFRDYKVDKLSNSDYDYTTYPDSGQVIINKITNDNGFIMVDAQVDAFENKTFKVINFNNDEFILECTDNDDIAENTIYNIRVKMR
ncbi:MAG TPA: hypothetical protein VK808_12465 [Bacteroidia bacterium]|jgi:hypothetical protein|nr:hypothetical protein [Bacteroidia bacterium]